MKKLLYVLRYQPDEGAVYKSDVLDLEPIREQIRQQLAEEEVPVVILPTDVVLFTIELGELDEAKEKELAREPPA